MPALPGEVQRVPGQPPAGVSCVSLFPRRASRCGDAIPCGWSPHDGLEPGEHLNILAFAACLSFSSLLRFPALKTGLRALLGF